MKFIRVNKINSEGLTDFHIFIGPILIRSLIDWNFRFGLQCGWSLVLGTKEKFKGYKSYFLTIYLLNVNFHVGFMRELQ